jgi:CubicO group peptidase (beta-lactamase class C family)
MQQFMKRTSACVLYVIHSGEPVVHQTSNNNPKCKDPIERKRYGIASVTKSLASLLFGFAFSESIYSSSFDLDQPISGELQGMGIDYKGGATFRDLLLMSSGMKWSESEVKKISIYKDEMGRPAGQHRTLRDAVKSRLEYAQFDEAKPFNYSGFDSQILGLLVENRLALSSHFEGNTLADSAQRFFWDDLNLQNSGEWKLDFDMHPPAHCCFYASASDSARIGYWVLEGYKNGKQPSSPPIEKWIRESIDMNVSTNNTCQFRDFDQELRYGYQWWVLSGNGNGFTGRGSRGQFLHVMPEFDVVIAQFGNWGTSWDETKECESYFVHRKIAEALNK